MKEPQQNRPADEEATLVVSGEEATLVAPRFDDEETLVARPVVPLEETAATEVSATGAAAPVPRSAYARLPFAPRRSGLLALVLVSVLTGGVLGGAGLYIYQRQSQEGAAGSTTLEQPPAEPQQQPAPAPTVEASNVPAPEAQVRPEVPAPSAPADEQTSAPDADADAPAAREAEQVPAAGRRDAGTPKRGKKGERDAELERPAPRADSVRPVSRADVAAEPVARRVDSISYRPRRAARRERVRRETVGDADRLRRIFEGTPE